MQCAHYVAVLVKSNDRVCLDVAFLGKVSFSRETESNEWIILLYTLYDGFHNGAVQAVILAEYNHGTDIGVNELF